MHVHQGEHQLAGGHLSHFELYLQAMQESGADAVSMQVFLEDLRGCTDLREALARPTLPPGGQAPGRGKRLTRADIAALVLCCISGYSHTI